MNLVRFIQKWSSTLAKYRRIKAHKPLRELPRVELIPVLETKMEFEKRAEEVREIITRLYLNTKKRGRPNRNEWEESDAA